MKKFFKNKKLLALIVAIVLVGGYFAYRAMTGSGTSAPKYVTAKVTRGTLVVSVSGTGQISASNQVNVQAQTSGIVTAVPVTDNQNVTAGQILVELDTTNDERSVRNAKANLTSAELQLQSLEQPATTSTLLQSQNAVAQAQQSLQNDQNNLATDYGNAYNDISNTFLDIPAVMTGLNNVLYAQIVNKPQADVDAYSNLISPYYPTVSTYNQSAVSSYQTALSDYNQNLADFKNSSVYSSTSTVESLLSETYNALKDVSVALSAAKNLLDLVNTTLEQNNQKVPAQLNTDETNLQSYITTTNSHLANLLQMQNSLQADKQAITTAGLTLAQSQAALAQLQAGPTALQVEQQELAVTQTQNALSDAEANLAYDYVRAPFTGVVTNVTAKVGQPASGALATLLSNTQIAQAALNEVDVVNVKVGQKATVTFDALPNVSLAGTVSEVDTVGTVNQGVVSYNVQVALDTPNSEVKPGMSDTVSIITKVDNDALLIPNQALTTRQGVSYVKVVQNGVPVQTQVTLGDSNDTMTQILSGLNAGDDVVTQTVTTGAATTQSSAGGGLRIPGGGGVLFGR